MIASKITTAAVTLAILVASFFGYGAYKDRSGYKRAAGEYTAKIEAVRIDLAARDIAERERQSAANASAKQRETERLAALELENTQLEQLLKEQAIASEQDPDRDRVCLGASSVRRIDTIR